jgi:hypothetical protein
VSYRGRVRRGAQVQFHSLPEHARDALVDCAAELAGQPWDAVIRPPGDDPRFREAVFGSGRGILGFYLDDDAHVSARFGCGCLRGDGGLGSGHHHLRCGMQARGEPGEPDRGRGEGQRGDTGDPAGGGTPSPEFLDQH